MILCLFLQLHLNGRKSMLLQSGCRKYLNFKSSLVYINKYNASFGQQRTTGEQKNTKISQGHGTAI
jgi:hypothetical protein